MSSGLPVTGAESGVNPSAAAPVKPDAAVQDGRQPAISPASAQPPSDDPDAEAFYKRLEQTGELEDVTDDVDVAALPPEVTHIRRPDGKIERIGFCAN